MVAVKPKSLPAHVSTDSACAVVAEVVRDVVGLVEPDVVGVLDLLAVADVVRLVVCVEVPVGVGDPELSKAASSST